MRCDNSAARVLLLVSCARCVAIDVLQTWCRTYPSSTTHRGERDGKRTTAVAAVAALAIGGTVTSAAAANPGGVIEPRQKATYTLQATMTAAATDACKQQTFTLPLTAELVQVAG